MSETKHHSEPLKDVLKRLRGERAEHITAIRERDKSRTALRKKIEQALASGPQTVPVLTDAVLATTDEVLWHVAAMRAYGQVAEDEQDGDYFKYRLVEETAKGR